MSKQTWKILDFGPLLCDDIVHHRFYFRAKHFVGDVFRLFFWNTQKRVKKKHIVINKKKHISTFQMSRNEKTCQEKCDSESEAGSIDFSGSDEEERKSSEKRKRPKHQESESEATVLQFSDSDQENQGVPKKQKRSHKSWQKKKNKKNKEIATEEAWALSPIRLYERWDFNRLSSIAELGLDPATEAVVSGVYSQLKENASTRLGVTYSARDFKQGRVYGKGLQGVNGSVRRLCSGEFYHDIDMANCAPNLLKQILEQANICPPLLNEYSNHRAAVFERLRTSDVRLRSVPDDTLKKVFLLGVHGGKHKNYLQKYLNFPQCDMTPVPELEAWENVLGRALKKLREKSKFHKKLWKQIKKSKDKRNPEGTFASWCWQVPENQIICELSNYFNKFESYTSGALVFDGLLLERKDVSTVPDAMLRRAETHILNTLGWQINLVEKPFQPTAEDWDFFWGERSLQKIFPVPSRLVYCLWWAGKHLKAVRFGDQVMLPHSSIPGVFVPKMAAEKFINETLKDKHAFSSVPTKYLLEWFEHSDHPKFQLMTKDNFSEGIISFTNGFLNIIKNEFTLWEGFEGEPPKTDHYFEVPIPLNGFGMPTPLFDSILETQVSCTTTRHVIEAMIGRLFFPTGLLDNWQLCLLLLGDSNTGKGTLVKLVTKMFPKKAIGCITAGKEISFGLESLHQKKIVIIPDVPRNFSKILHQQDFQSMISGEPVSIARKNKLAVADADWTVPLLLAANYHLDYKDESGAISRRLVIAHFKNLVVKRDTTLCDQIVKQELVVVMLRCLDRYRQLREQIGTADPWKHFTPTLLKARDEVQTNTSPLSSFLKDGDSYYQILFKEGHVTPLEDLNRAFSNFMKYTHAVEKVSGIGTDYFHLKSAGYQVKSMKYCKECNKESSKPTCGDHYSKLNRKNKVVVLNMKISKKEEEEEEAV